MFLTIGNVLSPAELTEVQLSLKGLEWRDGVATAGQRARSVKRNEQADLSSAAGERIVERVRKALDAQSVFQAAARPRTYSNLLMSRTQAGGGYGAHVDNASMGSGAMRLRSDLSFTLFLNEPDAYEGGNLNLEFPSGTQSIKLAAGDMVVYPSSLVHGVETVSSGVRIVMVGWVESQVRDAFKREVLFDLDRVRLGLSAGLAPDAERLVLDKVYSNLLRLWSGL